MSRRPPKTEPERKAPAPASVERIADQVIAAKSFEVVMAETAPAPAGTVTIEVTDFEARRVADTLRRRGASDRAKQIEDFYARRRAV